MALLWLAIDSAGHEATRPAAAPAPCLTRPYVPCGFPFQR